jgi:hypothetical protein
VISRFRFLLEPRIVGAAFCLAGLALLGWPSLLAVALGVELLATAFWWWARATTHPEEQIQRWSWLRRPAAALWLAFTIQRVIPTLSFVPSVFTWDVPAVLKWLQSLAVVWAGLELLAALPLARTYADVPGPLIAMRPWLPALLPSTGFVVLWRLSPYWVAVPDVRNAAVVLLLLTVWLATLRALGRRQLAAGLRWLMVADGALAGVVVASGAVGSEVSFLLWLGTFGGRAFVLAGELRGAASRRGAQLSRLWRIAIWTASAALAWPLLASLAAAPQTRMRLFEYLSAAIPVALGVMVTVGRLVAAPERRLVVRRTPGFSLGHIAATLTFAIGPTALAIAGWTGFRPAWLPALLGVVPPLAGAAAAMLRRPAFLLEGVRRAARFTSRGVLSRERGAVGLLAGLWQGMSAPVRDLHTGDAQEYLLFLVGVAVLALLLPLLQ